MPKMFERSKDTEAVVEVLRGVNNEISYFDLARRCKLGDGRTKAVLPSARRILMNENMVFDVRMGWGLVRLADADKAGLYNRRYKRINRQSHLGLKEIDTIEEFNRLPMPTQTKVTTARTVLSLTKSQTRVAQRPLPK